LRVPLEVLATKVTRARGESLEAAAREARYRLLAETLAEGEILLTAHHEDDQLETVLLQLFRGSGLAGIAAMPEIARFAGGWLARPLLSRSRAELEAWVRAQGLSWVEDETNAEERLDRNYLRRRVVPLIRERWPGSAAAVSRSARHAAQAQRLLDALALADVERASHGESLSVKALRALPQDRRRNALRFWIARSGRPMPETRRLDEMAGPLIDARPDANPFVAWGDAVVQRHADLLSLRAGSGQIPPEAQISWGWRNDTPCELPGDFGKLELKADERGPVDLDALPELLTVRWRRGGERLRPRRGGPRRALKSLLQEAHVSVAERARLPLVFSGEKLIAAADLWLDESVQAAPAARHRGRLLWKKSSHQSV
jgi:tRNA(Ile)-lysidine synthase